MRLPKKFRQWAMVCVLLGSSSVASAAGWPAAEAMRWYRAQPWLVGSNFIPRRAVNSLEMWQRETFDLAEIDRELGYAEKLGMNTMRVYLHDLVWQHDRVGFIARIDAFLDVAARRGIRPLFVLFDSCWNPNPIAGRQPAPRIGVHNSQWVQSPGLPALFDDAATPRLRSYVRGVVSAFARDRRILGWDVWNEPDNLNVGSYDDPERKLGAVREMLPQVFEWARSSNPVQPITSGVWAGDWSTDERLTAIQRIQLENSDVISFHHYGGPDDLALRIRWLERFGRPLFLTEYMARPLGSTFQAILPVARDHAVASFNWGFVAGRTQTYDPWDSWQKPYPPEGPPVWFHDLLYSDGTPFRRAETDFLSAFIRQARAAMARP